MAFKTIESLEEVLDPLKALRERYMVQQSGPLRHFDKEMRCTSRRCGSSTFYKLRGMPRCITHALMEMNQMLVELGVDH